MSDSPKSEINDVFTALHYVLTKVAISGKLSTVRTKVSFNDLLTLAKKPTSPEHDGLFIELTIDTNWTDDSPLSNSTQTKSELTS